MSAVMQSTLRILCPADVKTRKSFLKVRKAAGVYGYKVSDGCQTKNMMQLFMARFRYLLQLSL